MIGKRMSRAFFGVAVLCAAIASVVLLDARAAPAKPHDETPEEAAAFLDRFVGEWIGEGTADGIPIRSRLVCDRVLDAFLLMQDREIREPDDGGFQADTYVGYRVEKKRYELYTFNNNTGLGSSLPFRSMTGHRAGELLVMEEKGGLRYTFEFLDDDTFRLTKSFVKGHHEPPLVIEIFRRQ